MYLALEQHNYGMKLSSDAKSNSSVFLSDDGIICLNDLFTERLDHWVSFGGFFN